MMMTWSMALQGVMFAAAVWGWVRVLRAVPRYWSRGGPPRVWGVLGGAAAAVVAPAGIAVFGHRYFWSIGASLTAATVLLLTAGIGVIVVGWRAGLPRGRRRCPSCWYDMTGIPVGDGARCPECGRGVRTERELRRVRRSAWLVVTGVMLVGSSYLALKVEEMGEHGWQALAPATGMIVGLPWMPWSLLIHGDGSLQSRGEEGRLWGWQVALLEGRARGVVRRSAKPEALVNAAPFVGRRGRENVRLSERAIVALAEEMEAGVGNAARVSWLAPLFPESFSPDTQGRIHGPVVRGLGSKSKWMLEAAASLAVRMPVHADELAVLLNARAAENGFVADALAQMSMWHEGAWELYRARLATPGDPGRHWAVLVSYRADEKRVAPILDAALDDPDAGIAVAAVRTLTSWAFPMTPARHERLVRVAMKRPAMRREIVRRIDGTSDLLIELLRGMLRSTDKWQRRGALEAIARTGAGARELAADVEGANPGTLDQVGLEAWEAAMKAVREVAGEGDAE